MTNPNEPAVPVSALRALLTQWHAWQTYAGQHADPSLRDGVCAGVGFARDDLAALIERYVPAPKWGIYIVPMGQWVINFVAYARPQAEERLSDRVANGHAFPGEEVRRLPEVCDAQEHATEQEHRSCPVCHPPYEGRVTEGHGN